MHASSAVTYVVIAALVVWVISRQMIERPVSPRRLFLLPGLIALLGIEQLAGAGHLTGRDLEYLAADLGVSIVLGFARGWTVQLHERSGFLWRRGNWLTLALWVVSIAARLGIGLLASHQGADVVAKYGLTLSFGLSLAAQGLIIYKRSLDMGVPFADITRTRRTS